MIHRFQRSVAALGLLTMLSSMLSSAAAQSARPPFLFPDGIVFDVAFSRDGHQFAIACEDKAVRIYDWKTARLLHTLSEHNLRVWTIAFSPDGKSLAACTGDYAQPDDPGEIKIWNLATGKARHSLQGHRGLIFCVAYSGDGKTLYSGGWDGTVRVWDVDSGKETAVLDKHGGPVRRLAFTPDKRFLVSASFDGEVRLWNPATNEREKTIRCHDEGVQTAVFTPNSKVMITCSRPITTKDPGVVKLWDVASGKENSSLEGPTRWILSLAVSPDGSMLAVVGGYLGKLGEVKVFDLATSKELANLLGHKEWVECVAFSPNGQWLVSGGRFTRGAAGELRLWDLHRLIDKK